MGRVCGEAGCGLGLHTPNCFISIKFCWVMRPYGGDDSLVQPVGTMPCCGGTWTCGSPTGPHVGLGDWGTQRASAPPSCSSGSWDADWEPVPWVGSHFWRVLLGFSEGLILDKSNSGMPVGRGRITSLTHSLRVPPQGDPRWICRPWTYVARRIFAHLCCWGGYGTRWLVLKYNWWAHWELGSKGRGALTPRVSVVLTLHQMYCSKFVQQPIKHSC